MTAGLMQDATLNVTGILDYAAKWHPNTEVVTRTVEGPTVVTTYQAVHKRARLCAIALQELGVRPGSFVATMAWNTARHMEAWYGIMGCGAICHTLNPRLSDSDITYIATDAGDEVLIADASMWAQLLRVVPAVPSVRNVILLTDRLGMPDASACAKLGVPVHCFEDLLAAALPGLPNFHWVQVAEGDACGMCYTSGTTGKPKGVLYSHRSNYLHAMLLLQSDSLPLGAASACLMVVPMFHANSWGLVFAAPMVGARLVLPGPWLDGASLYNLIEAHGVTVSAGVPTVWLSLLAYMEEAGLRFSTMKMTAIGGAAAPRSMVEAFELKHGVDVRHLWGMTELSPLGTVGCPSPAALAANRRAPSGAATQPSQEALVRVKMKQGRPHVLCDMRIVDDEGKVVPQDGKAVGHLQVKGPATVARYFKAAQPATDAEGWFSTGDVASIDPYGGMCITDRSKDVIKSGGEWISSIEVENLAHSCPGVREAAVVAMPDERWGERPLMVVALKDGLEQNDDTKHAILRFLETKLARFAVPDDVVFVDEIPHNATGKVSKLTLREMFKDHKPPPKPKL